MDTQISKQRWVHRSKREILNPNSVNLERSIIIKKKKKRHEDNEIDILNEYRTEFNQTLSSIATILCQVHNGESL